MLLALLACVAASFDDSLTIAFGFFFFYYYYYFILEVSVG